MKNWKILLSGLAMAFLGVIITSCDSEDEVITEFHEAVVIGSGYGGSVSALRLGEAGVKTLVLERGRYWTIQEPGTDSTFATLESRGLFKGDKRSTWLSDDCTGNIAFFKFPLACDRYTGVLELQTGEPNKYAHEPKMTINGFLNIWIGAGVGGGSLSNNGVTYRPSRKGWELAYDLETYPYLNDVWNDLEGTYFQKAEDMLRPTTIPADILASEYYESTRLHMADMVQAGFPMEGTPGWDPYHGTSFAPLILDWDVVREEIAGTKVASIINGEAWHGTNSGAKFSLDKDDNYLGKARDTGNVEIRALHTVSSISFDGTNRIYKIRVIQTDEKYRTVQLYDIYTPHLISSAGSVGTTKLMVAAKGQGGLPDLNSHVGTKWSQNGNSATFRQLKYGWVKQGGLAGTKTTNFDDPNAPFVIENLPHRVSPLIFLLAPEEAWVIGSALTIAVGVPSKTGNFTWNPVSETVDLYWPEDGAKNIYDAFFAQINAMDYLGKHREMTIDEAQRVSLHPLGGMPLGLATDNHCQVKNYNFLYAVDGSIIPGASALVNPSLLITAMAERCMGKVAADVVANIAKLKAENPDLYQEYLDRQL